MSAQLSLDRAARLYQQGEMDRKYNDTMRWKFALAMIKLTEYLYN
jgi:hypothetical protein